MPPESEPAASAPDPAGDLAELTAEVHALEAKEAADAAAENAQLDQLKPVEPAPVEPMQLEPNPDAPPAPIPATPATPAPAGITPTAEQVAAAEEVAAGNADTIAAVPEPDAATETPAEVYANFLAALDQIVADSQSVADLTARGYALYKVDQSTGEASPAIPPAPSSLPPVEPPAEPALVEGVDVDHEGNPLDTPAPIEPAPVKGVDVPLTTEEVLANLLGPIVGPPPTIVEPAPVDHPDPIIPGDHSA